MKASVIIPYYKKKMELLNLLNSLNDQTYKDYEVIIINDGSDDIKEDILKEKHDYEIKCVKYERNEKSGRAFARNRGIELADGSILIFLDSDQIVDKNFIEMHCRGFIDSKNLLQFGTRKMLQEQVDLSKDKLQDVIYKEDARHQIFRKYDYQINQIEGIWHLVFTHNLSIPKNLVELYGGFDENFLGWGLEDVEFAYRMKSQGVAIVFNPFVETYDQVESEDIDAEKRWHEWKRNFEIFCKKYNKPEIWCQEVFINNMLIERKKALLNAGIEKPWIYCFFQFESMLKELKNKYNYSQERYWNDLKKKSDFERKKEAEEYFFSALNILKK